MCFVIDWRKPIFDAQHEKVMMLESRYKKAKNQNAPNLRSLEEQLGIEKNREAECGMQITFPITVLIIAGAILLFVTFPPKRKQLI